MFGRVWAEWLTFVVCLALGVAVGLHSEKAFGRETGNPFYKNRIIPGSKGVPCCTRRDCRRLDGYRMLPGGEYEILMPEGYWFKPDPKIVLKDVTPDGKAHACWQDRPTMAFAARKRVVFCVWIPIMFM